MDFFGFLGMAISLVTIIYWLVTGKFPQAGSSSSTTAKPSTRPKVRSFTPNRPDIYYHATSLPIADDIYDSGCFLVSNLGALYVANDFDTAHTFGTNKGAVVILKIAPNVSLQKISHIPGGYYLPIPNAKPYEEYYRIRGIDPIAVADKNGQIVRGSVN